MGPISTKYAHLIDRLLESGVAFACYFLPNTSEPVLVVEETPEQLESYQQLAGRHGFVFAPFHIDESEPVILFPTDTTYHGFDVEIDIPAAGGDSLQMTDDESTSYPGYAASFDRFMEQLQNKRFAKLVLSRKLVVNRDSQSIGSLFLTANQAYPSAFTYLVFAPQCGLWFGATPELLIRGRDERFQTVALAGTMPASVVELAYEWSDKNREEQQMVTDYIIEQLAQCGISDIDVEGPVTVKAGSVVHLKTQFVFECHPEVNLGVLIEMLHPTPAVCGLPKGDSRKFILETEEHNRSYYTGFVGVINRSGETDLYVNLRCMKVTQNQLILYAGGGITSKSVGSKEWSETEHKLQTLLSIIR